MRFVRGAAIVVAIIAVLALLAAIAACGNDNADKQKAKDAGPSKDEVHNAGWKTVTSIAGACEGHGKREDMKLEYDHKGRLHVFVICTKGDVFEARQQAEGKKK